MRFVEKPDLEKAKEYLADGAYLWSSGMFVWKISTIMGKFKALLPDMHAELLKIAETFGRPEYSEILLSSFEKLGKISVDYAIMGGRRMIATTGLEDMVIVDTEDVLLICDKDHTQAIKKIIEHLKTGNHDGFL